MLKLKELGNASFFHRNREYMEVSMKSISLYEDLSTPIHRLAPLSKLLYVITVLLLPVIWGRKEVTVGCIILSIGVLLIGSVLRKTLPIIGCSAFVILTVVLIQGLFRAENVTPVWTIGSLTFYKEGLVFALGIGINIINLLLGFSVLILTTKPSDLVEALVRKGLSPKIGYVLSSVFQIIPQMSTTMATITDAQRSRGMETEGKLLTRIKAFIPLMGPVVMNSLVATRERAIALEVRGFNSKKKKSFLNVYKPTKVDYMITIILLVLIILSVVGRILLWRHLL